MSLLLDALNRASKDKAAAAASAATSVVAPVPVAPAKPVTPAPESQATPALDLVFDLPSQMVQPGAALTSDWPTLELAQNPIESEPTLALADPVIELAPPPPTPPAPVQHEAKAEPSAMPAPTPEPQAKLSQPAPDEVLKLPKNAARVAQSIVRAKAPGAPTGRTKRLLALGGLAVLLAAGLGSVMLGWWGDPMSWLQTSSLQSKSAPPAIAAIEAAPVEPVAPAAIATLPAQTVVSAPIRVAAALPPKAVPHPIAKPPIPPRPPAATARAGTAPDECKPGQSSSDCQGPTQTKPTSTLGKERQTIVKSQSNGPSALELGYAALTQGRLREAEQAYTQALAGNSEERDALLGLAYIAHQQGRLEEARDYYKRVLRQEPGNPVAKSGLLTLSTTDDAQELGSRSREVAEQNPDSAAAQSILGHSLARQGRLADARQAFYKAQLLEPGVALHAFNLAVALDRLRQYGPARQYYERTIVLSDKNGGERSSGVPVAAVQARLEQLQAASNTPEAR